MDLAVHPDFTKNPDKFAFSHKVNLTNCVLPETSFKADRETGEKLANQKANIIIGQHEAIRLFVENDGDGYRLRSIAVKPLELYEAHANSNSVRLLYLKTALSLLKSQVAPLLANPLDARHIIPSDAENHPVSYISQVKISALFNDIEIPCLHNLSHPLTGPVQGSTKKRVELRSGDGDCTILFEKVSWDEPVGGHVRYTEGIHVKLALKGKPLVSQFSLFGSTQRVGNTKRLVKLCILEAYHIFDMLMAQLGGTYVPVPPEWSGMGKPVTHAKTIALLAELTGIPVGEIRDMDQTIRKPSKSTIERLDHDVQVAATCLKPIPIARLFGH
jgi:hypothetical protein